MTRTTISLHESIFRKVKFVAQREHCHLGEVISELLSLGLKTKFEQFKKKEKDFQMKTYTMGKPLIPLEDKDAIWAAFDKEKS